MWDLIPENFKQLVDGFLDCPNRHEALHWMQQAADRVANAVAEDPDRHLTMSAWEMSPRALCPLCGDGSRGPYDEGFSLTEGLMRHLSGSHNANQCSVFHVLQRWAMDESDER